MLYKLKSRKQAEQAENIFLLKLNSSSTLWQYIL